VNDRQYIEIFPGCHRSRTIVSRTLHWRRRISKRCDCIWQRKVCRFRRRSTKGRMGI
jgi:hypothetical protein